MFETTWGLRRELEKAVRAGNKKAELYWGLVTPLEVIARDTEHGGFPATTHKFRATYVGPHNAWKTFIQHTDEKFIRNADKIELRARLHESARIISIMEMEIKHPIPPVIDMSSEERVLHEIEVLKMSLGRLTDAIDVFLSTVTIATNPIFLDAGNLKKEIIRTITPRKLATFKMLFDYKDKLIDLIQKAELLLARPITYDLLKKQQKENV